MPIEPKPLKATETYATRQASLRAMKKEDLEAALLDREYNGFLRDYADYRKDEDDAHGHGKRIPYIGWFWRSVDFARGEIRLGWCGEFVGFMENNKWGYPERRATPEEFQRIVALIDEAMYASGRGGLASEIMKETYACLDELWAYLQTLPAPPERSEL